MELPTHHHPRLTLVEGNTNEQLTSDRKKGICYSDGDENYDHTSGGDDETEENRTDDHFETRVNVDATSLEEENQSDSSDDIFPSAATHANPIEPLKQEYLEDCSNDILIDQPSSGNVFYDSDHENDDNNNDLNNEQSIQPSNSSSGVRSSSRKRIPKRALDYDHLNEETVKRRQTIKRESVQSNVLSNVVHMKKVEPKIVEEDYDDDDGADNDEEEEDDEKEEETKRNQTVILELHCTEFGCRKIVTNRSLWREHMKRDHQKTPYQKLVANVRTNNSGQKPEYRCPDARCRGVYKSQESFQNHWRRYHHPGRYKCPLCHFEDNLYYKVQNHLDFVHGAHECTHDGCGRKFSRLSMLKKHQSVHTEERPYWCVWPGCRWRFKLAFDAIKHIRVKHFKVKKQNDDQNAVDSRDPNEFIVKKIRRVEQG